MKGRAVFIIAVIAWPATASEQCFKTLISIEEIRMKTDDFFVEGVIKVSIKENSKELSNIEYSYLRIGPVPVCGLKTNCASAS